MKKWTGDDIEQENVVVPEDEDGDVSAQAEAKLTKMREELAAVRKEKQEYMDGWQRAKADYVNLLRRSEEGAGGREQEGKIKAVSELLPAFDALERAKEHGELPGGFLAIAKQMEAAFAKLGLEETGKIGEKFNPAYHEALGRDNVETPEQDDIITAILEKGWRVGDSIIRAAKVRVGHFS